MITKGYIRCINLDREYVVVVIMVLGFFILLFGLNGLYFLIVVALFFFLPTYLMINKLKITQGEKLIYSCFIGAGLFPTAAYYLAILLKSFLAGIIAAFAVLMGIGLLVRRGLR